MKSSSTFIGSDIQSWKFLSTMAQEVNSSHEDSFGYFVYSPDAFAYEPKYATKYAFSQRSTIEYFKKQSKTILFLAPPPRGNPYMQDEWWTKNQLRITSDPIDTIQYANGYKVEVYELTDKEQKITFDESIDPGIHFR